MKKPSLKFEDLTKELETMSLEMQTFINGTIEENDVSIKEYAYFNLK